MEQDILNAEEQSAVQTGDGEKIENNSGETQPFDGQSAPVSDEKENFGAGDCRPAEPAEAEKNTAVNGYGKFKSAEALLKAYLSLEAEFTRRSQKLKELEESKANPSPASPKEEELITAAMNSDKVKSAIVSDYLKTVFSGRSVPFTVGGAPCAAPKSAPRSVKEAGALADRFLKN